VSLQGARLLFVLPQDPASGAARSNRTLAEMLSAASAEVRVLATTVSEASGRLDAAAYLRELGIHPSILPKGAAGRLRPELEFTDRRIPYHLLDAGGRDMQSWQKIAGSQFDRMFDCALTGFRPTCWWPSAGFPARAS